MTKGSLGNSPNGNRRSGGQLRTRYSNSLTPRYEVTEEKIRLWVTIKERTKRYHESFILISLSAGGKACRTDF